MRDLSAEAQQRFTKTAEAFLRNPRVSPGRDAESLGWDCLAAAALLDAGDSRAKAKLQSIADQLAASAVKSPDGVSKGWGVSVKAEPPCKEGEYDAFRDGTCNGKDTTYGIETGLGLACMAKASAALGERKYLAIADQIFSHWQGFKLPAHALCSGCLYFAISDNANDRGRYVRNMNVFMGLGAASLADVTHDQKYASVANGVMRSDIAEERSGNHGYLGRLDPDWRKDPAKSAENIENHSAAMAVGAAEVGRTLRSPASANHGLTVWSDWATCSNGQCMRNSCNGWGADASKCQATLTAAHCAFRRRSALAASRCEEYLHPATLPPTSVQSFGLWSVLVGAKQP